MSVFEELGVCPELIRVADEQGWLLPTPVQSEAVPLILGGGDVLAAAETGSGKTGAFGMPILQIVHEAMRNAAATNAAAGGGGGAAAASTASAAGVVMSLVRGVFFFSPNRGCQRGVCSICCTLLTVP